MKISVIIPTYNREKYLSEAIDSVLSQTYQDFEIIIVDDGSTDNTREIVSEYINRFSLQPKADPPQAEPAIHYFYQDNKGPAAARNLGIKQSKGGYIAFLDSDDVWLPEKLEVQVERLDKCINVSLVYSDMGEINSDGKIIEANTYLFRASKRPSGYIFHDLLIGTLISTITVMVRKSTLQEVGSFSEDLLVGEDYEMWLRISKFHRIEFVDKVVALRRSHALSTSKINDILVSEPWEAKVIKRILDKYPGEQKKIGYAELKLRLSKPYFDIGYNYFFKGDRGVALTYFRKALQLSPLTFRYLKFYVLSFLNMGLILKSLKLYLRGEKY